MIKDSYRNRLGSAIILLLFVLLNLACNTPDLNGHWHITSIKEGEKIMGSDYLTLDIYDDTLGTINKQVFLSWSHFGRIDFWKQEMLFGGECFVLEFKFTLQEEDLLLRQIAYTEPGEKQYIAKRCEANCCSQQEDYFSSTMLEIDLPQKLDSINAWEAGNTSRSLIYPLFFGLAKSSKKTKNRPIQFTIGRKDVEVHIDSIAMYEEEFLMYVPEENWKRLKRILYADKNTPLNKIIPVVKKYKALGIHKMLVALQAKDSKGNFTVWYQPIALSTIITANNPSITWGVFLGD